MMNSQHQIELWPKEAVSLHSSYQEVVETNIDKILVEIKGNKCLLFFATISISSGILGSAFIAYNLHYFMQSPRYLCVY